MPNRPANISKLDQTALHIINQNARETNDRIDDLARKLPPHSHIKSQTGAITFGSIPANSAVEATAYLNGATTNGVAHCSPKLTLGNVNLNWVAYVSQQNQITIRVSNVSTSPITPNAVKWNIWCIQ